MRISLQKSQRRRPAMRGKKTLGIITTDNYSRIFAACEAVAPPKKQFDGPRHLYPAEPLRRCQEWTREAVQTLKDAGVLQ